MERKNSEAALKKRIRSGEVTREDVARRLAELAFGKANDCVRLVLIPPREAPQSHYPIYLERLDTHEPSQEPPFYSHSVPTMVFNHHKSFVGIKLNKHCHRGKIPQLKRSHLTSPLVHCCEETHLPSQDTAWHNEFGIPI